MEVDGVRQLLISGSPRRANGRHDAASRRVQLLVARSTGTEGELLDPVPAERRMRVAVDEPGNRAEASAVELFHGAGRREIEVAHSPHRLDALAVAEHESVLDDLELTEVPPAERSGATRRRHDLTQVADQ